MLNLKSMNRRENRDQVDIKEVETKQLIQRINEIENRLFEKEEQV